MTDRSVIFCYIFSQFVILETVFAILCQNSPKNRKDSGTVFLDKRRFFSYNKGQKALQSKEFSKELVSMKDNAVLFHTFSTNDRFHCRFDYYLISVKEEWRTPHRYAYSLFITETDGICVTDHAFFYDIGEDADALSVFLQELAQGAVTPQDAQEIVTDFLCERY